MRTISSLSPALRGLLVASAVVLASLAAPGAHAQAVAVVVNGEPITTFDIEQRTRLVQVSTHKTPVRKDVVEELIDEKIKIQQAKKYNFENVDKEVDNSFAGMARRMRATPAQFTENLGRSGVMPGTLKSRIKAELIWSQLVRGKYQSAFQFTDKDILAKLETSKTDESATVGYDYTLRPITFIVPRGSPQTLVEMRKREAEALRSRFKDCEQDVAFARGQRDVAVRAPVIKTSAELPKELRDILDKTEMGRLTSPEVTAQGVEVYALCGKKPSASENAPGRRKVREEMYSEQFKVLSERFLKELRSQSMIEYR